MTTMQAVILKRFRTYQWHCDTYTMLNLYKDLVEEEVAELIDAIQKNDIIEIYDACCDIYWVCTIYDSLHYKIFDIPSVKAGTYIKFVLDLAKSEDRSTFNDCMQEVIRSNFTKEVTGNLQGKVKKWDYYEPPVLSDILKKHGLI